MQVLIVDDHDFIRRGIRSLLAETSVFQVCGEAIDGRDAVEKAKELKPDVITMDLSMPRMSGIEATEQILRFLPDVHVLILSQHNSTEAIRQAIRRGASGYISKSVISQELISALEAISQGDTYFKLPLLTTEQVEIDEVESRLAAIVESSDDAIISKNLNGIVMSWNPAAERMFGFTALEAIGSSITIIIPSELQHEEKQILDRLRMGQHISHYETVRRRKDGSRLDVSLTISPIRNSRGTIIGASKIARDVTDRKRIEKILKEAELSGRLLQLQDEERRRIARELHDGVGQSLAAVAINTSKMLSLRDTLDSTVVHCVEENVQIIKETISEIRTVSHLLHPPLLEEVGLRSALEEYVRGFAERSRVEVKLDVQKDLERLPPPYELSVFRIVQECLTNIHRHSGSKTAAVRLAQTVSGIELEVTDEGRGMDTEIQERFATGKSRGVGLRGMRERVRQLGGSLEIQSGEQGTSVRAILPMSSMNLIEQTKF